MIHRREPTRRLATGAVSGPPHLPQPTIGIDGSDGGGQIRIPAVTDHVASSLDLLETFGFDPALDTSGATPTVSMAE